MTTKLAPVQQRSASFTSAGFAADRAKGFDFPPAGAGLKRVFGLQNNGPAATLS